MGGPSRQMQEAIVRFLWSVSLVRVAGNLSVIWPDASIFMHMGWFTEYISTSLRAKIRLSQETSYLAERFP